MKLTTRINRSTVDNLCVAFFLLLVLFLPRADEFTRFYFAILIISAPLLLGGKKLCFDWLSIIGIGTLFIFVISTVLRFTFIVDPNLRDYTEFGRFFLPALILIFRDKFKNVTVKTIFSVFALYACIDLFASILAFSGMDIMGIGSIVQKFYVSEGHAGLWYRVSGLSAGPGQHGVMMVVLFIFFYVRTFQAKRILFPLIFSAIVAVPLFLSQSRTAIIVFLIISISVPIYYLIYGKNSQKKRSIPILTVILSGSIYVFSIFYTYFDRVIQLLNGINQVSSFQKRATHSAHLLDKAAAHPVFFFIGYGKEFFETSVFDNEYLLLFLVHGPFVTLVIIGGTLIYILKFLTKKDIEKYNYSVILLFLLSAGLVIAYPSTFFLQFTTIPIIMLFINLAFWEQKKLNEGV